jgi:hypothetical protein
VVGGCPGELGSTHPGQGVEELRLELTSLVRGDSLRATETGYPADNEGVCHGLGCDVRDWNCFWPAREDGLWEDPTTYLSWEPSEFQFHSTKQNSMNLKQ